MTLRTALFAIAAFAALAANRTVAAAELVMLEQAGCAWCARFNAEIAPGWPKTEEGRKAPLRRVDVNAPWPADLAGITRERFTPTFVVVAGGVEIGRLRGYPGDEFFWFRIGEILAKVQ